MTTIDHLIAGIPCQLQVLSFNRVKGSHRHDAPSDLDFHGYTEMDFAVLDRRGRPAAWLEKKITPKIEDEIRERIAEYMEDE